MQLAGDIGKATLPAYAVQDVQTVSFLGMRVIYKNTLLIKVIH
ncbi:hypothetical protein YPPY66_1989 [Yersinia pestis PY-66]|uniref:Uncharacterized protein n=2 Tax=Yersinia pestis TaxID=632 RepID=A0AAV3B5T4_YERPE|nr:hypothetical protein YPIP275_0166 [Yersinia pestis biovar Orientalis str. IP275]EDR40581.1 hypothetical protein YpF1991016_0152 [Yersinia pestis biovar Orientalis str. F1991016]EDR44024.1 hypothetical protein YpE1979001_0595 [Yersinia pestis biovar Antiqua str. E1979001]EDR51566.1 hypothetical protein YpB42003004_2553 [Yersinia pestis biovar Antiqua str. B42003004]EDR56254.1 hypothetical protein YpMG051020_1808 [Yersinia pestis biovar Orientalis str. MG05-1020]EDR66516.1 hypothetical protei